MATTQKHYYDLLIGTMRKEKLNLLQAQIKIRNIELEKIEAASKQIVQEYSK